MNTKIHIIGIDDIILSQEKQKLLSSCTQFFGAERFQKLLPNQKIRPITPLKNAIEEIKKRADRENIAVFASGDPLFYGIGKTLLYHFPKERLHFSPALSSIQRAASLFALSWQDAHCISLHGKELPSLPSLFLSYHKTIALTDNKNTPNHIAKTLLSYLQKIEYLQETENWQISVAENIGERDQKLFQGSLAECAEREFSPLNIFCMHQKNGGEIPVYNFGLSEDEITHSRGLITKNEVRAATLHALQLPQQGVFWDIGAGSGSISIEAARLNPALQIFAIEHKKEEIENIKENIRRYRTFSILPIFGRAPEALEMLPDPDRIFIGGSSGTLKENIAIAKKRLLRNGRIIINGVTKKTIQSAPIFLERYGFSWQSSTIEVCRKTGGEEKKFNPITIITATPPKTP